jgi:hypothetical protein
MPGSLICTFAADVHLGWMHLNICIIRQTNSKQQRETNQQSTIVTQQGAYAYPVPIGNPRFRVESRLRKSRLRRRRRRRRRCSRKERGDAQFSNLRRSRMGRDAAFPSSWKPRTPSQSLVRCDFCNPWDTSLYTAAGSNEIWELRDRDYRIGSNFWKFYLIRTDFTLGEPVFWVKVFRLFRLE